MKNDILYVNGCSFAYGVGIAKNADAIKRMRFSVGLAAELGLTEMNMATPGSCNARIHRRAVMDIIENRPKLAVIIWSDPARFEVMWNTNEKEFYGEDAEQVRPLSIYSYRSSTTKAFESYYTTVTSNHRDIVYTMQAMAGMKILCDSLEIPCIQLPYKFTFHRELYRTRENCVNKELKRSILQYEKFLGDDPLIFGVKDKISFDSIVGIEPKMTLEERAHMLSEIPGQEGHPNLEGHGKLHEWLSNLIHDKKLI